MPEALVKGQQALPLHASLPDTLRGKAVVVRLDGCAFVDKVLRATEAGTWLPRMRSWLTLPLRA